MIRRYGMTSNRRCDNGCFYCKEWNDDGSRNGGRDYCDYAMCVLTHDRKFFISIVGCVSYLKR
jgi:hypothetical protein